MAPFERFAYVWSRNLILGCSLLISQPCYAIFGVIWDFISRYQVGVEYSKSFDRLNLSYESPTMPAMPESCEEKSDDPSKQICSLGLAAGHSSGYGLFLQPAFRRRGDFYFSFDVNFTARYLTGGLLPEETEELKTMGVPLYDAHFSLVSLIMLPYIKVGYTPLARFPDIFLSIGPALQTAVGDVRLNEQSRRVAVALSSGTVGYTELELVLFRFGDGAFSLYASQAHAGRNATPFYPDVLEGITDVKAGIKRGKGGSFFGFGGKLLLNWP